LVPKKRLLISGNEIRMGNVSRIPEMPVINSNILKLNAVCWPI